MRRPVPVLALCIVGALAFLGGGFTVAMVVFVLVPLWAIVTVVRWSTEGQRRRRQNGLSG